MPSPSASSARLPWIPEPGENVTPIGSVSSKASVRLKGSDRLEAARSSVDGGIHDLLFGRFDRREFFDDLALP